MTRCGYLFVAPDWDFSNPINRTKRWQRRWFVLYDDGELTYSVDDHPETIPQVTLTQILSPLREVLACVTLNLRDLGDCLVLTPQQ